MDDYVICDTCGKKLYEKDGPILRWEGGCVCKACFREEAKWQSIWGQEANDIPQVCMSCGGDYPRCKTSCKIMDA